MNPEQVHSALIADRPPAFTYGGDGLCCEHVPLKRLAEEFGTPLYVYSGTEIRRRFRIFDDAFAGVPHTVCYSIKANSNLNVLKLLAQSGSGFDIVSGGELQRALTVAPGIAGKIVFSGVGKTAAEMDAALKAGILLFNVESESEMEMLAARAVSAGVMARIAFRVNPDVPADTHPYISTGLHKHKFGIPIAEALRLYRLAAGHKQLEVAGVSAHIGSQIRDTAPFAIAVTKLAGLVRELRAEGLNVRYVDAGGGLGIPYQPHEIPDFAAEARTYARALTEPLSGLDVHLLLEPGRAVIAPAGVLVTRVLYRKHNNGKRFLVVDSGMNDLIRPSLYGAHHQIIPVGSATGPTSHCDVVGPICESGDFFARERELPELTEGSLLAILDAGAYGMSLASNYNTRPRPAEVMIEGQAVRLIRRREKVTDLLAAECL